MVPKLLRQALTPSSVMDVLSMYRQRHRFYHNDLHIYEMFQVADDLQIELTLAQQLAILFHDVVYVAGAKHNEEQSVDLMYAYTFKSDIAVRTVDEAADIIIATKTHVTNNADALIVLDLDLYRFAVPYDNFNMHTTEILVENIHLIDSGDVYAEFTRLRSEFLIKFLSCRDKIYQTAVMSQFEDAAQNNISRYLAQ